MISRSSPRHPETKTTVFTGKKGVPGYLGSYLSTGIIEAATEVATVSDNRVSAKIKDRYRSGI